jgi:hypothetical protein
MISSAAPAKGSTKVRPQTAAAAPAAKALTFSDDADVSAFGGNTDRHLAHLPLLRLIRVSFRETAKRQQQDFVDMASNDRVLLQTLRASSSTTAIGLGPTKPEKQGLNLPSLPPPPGSARKQQPPLLSSRMTGLVKNRFSTWDCQQQQVLMEGLTVSGKYLNRVETVLSFLDACNVRFSGLVNMLEVVFGYAIPSKGLNLKEDGDAFLLQRLDASLPSTSAVGVLCKYDLTDFVDIITRSLPGVNTATASLVFHIVSRGHSRITPPRLFLLHNYLSQACKDVYEVISIAEKAKAASAYSWFTPGDNEHKHPLLYNLPRPLSSYQWRNKSFLSRKIWLFGNYVSCPAIPFVVPHYLRSVKQLFDFIRLNASAALPPGSVRISRMYVLSQDETALDLLLDIDRQLHDGCRCLVCDFDNINWNAVARGMLRFKPLNQISFQEKCAR